MLCAPGDPVELRPEPKNPVDPNAVAVFSERGIQLGYVAAERALFVGSMWRAGHELTAIFQDVAPWGAIVRVGVDCAPALPPAREEKEPEDWYGVDPDPGWPD